MNGLWALVTLPAVLAVYLAASIRRHGYDAGYLEGIRATVRGYRGHLEEDHVRVPALPWVDCNPANDDVLTGHRYTCTSCGFLVFAAIHHGPANVCMTCQFSKQHGLPISRAADQVDGAAS